MLRWALVFFVVAVIAAALGFGGIAGGFANLAVIAFWLFVALFVISLLAGLVTGGHVTRGGGAVATLVVAGLVGAGVYAWVDHGMSAEKLGAAMDHKAIEMRADAADAVETAQVETTQAVGEIAADTREAADDVGDDVEHATDADRARD